MKPNNPLTRSFLENHPVDAARALERFSGRVAGEVVGGVDDRLAAGVIEKTIPQAAARILRSIPPEKAAGILEEMETVAASRAVTALGTEKAAAITAMSGAKLKAIRRLTVFPGGSAGALMETNPVVFRQSVTVKDAVAALKRKKGAVTGGIYVVDDGFRLAGTISAISLIKAERTSALGALADQRATPSVSVWTALSALASHPGWERRRFMPVVERRDVLAGEIHYWRVAQAMARQVSAAPGDPFESVLEAAAVSWAAGAELLGLSLGSGENKRHDGKRE